MITRFKVRIQEICPRKYLTLFSGKEGWAAWPSAPSHVAYFFAQPMYDFRRDISCTTKESMSFHHLPTTRPSFFFGFFRNFTPLQSPPGLPHLWEDWIVHRSERSLILGIVVFPALPWQWDWLHRNFDDFVLADSVRWRCVGLVCRCTTFRRWYLGVVMMIMGGTIFTMARCRHKNDERWASRMRAPRERSPPHDPQGWPNQPETNSTSS